MNKNKSIDGLSVRSPKKSATSSLKTSSKTKSTAIKSKTTKNSTKPKVKKVPVVDSNPTTPEKPTPSIDNTQTSSVEDFLKPVQAFNFDETTGELKAADPSTTKSSPKIKAKKPKSKKRKVIIITIIIIVLILAGLITGFILWGNDIIAKITGGQGNVFDLLSFTEETYEPLKTDENGRTNILAFGTSGYNMEGEEGNGIHDGAQLTDSIMVISLNQDNGDVAMLSLPRDLKTSPICTATGKINEIYWCNNMNGDNEQAGAEALMTEVSDILGLDFQYYAHVNWGSLVQVVDILDGITITLDEDISDYYWTGAVFKAGVEYTINGEEALGLARARHGTTGGDFSRGASQQKILIGIKDKVSEKNLSLTEIIDLASTIGDNLRTNFSVEEIKTLAHLASDFDFDSIRQISLLEPNPLMTTGSINDISYVLPSAGVGNYGSIQKYITKAFSSDPRVYEDYAILVLNGTETPGLASTEKTTLEKENFDNIYIDDAPTSEYADRYTLYALTDSAPGVKKLLEEKYSQTAKTIDELPEDIPENYDFVIIVGSNDTSSE
ncbi:LCP family protein [Candidatus Saccharibacteria bacterium]|nr:LCP family protein [Candidatus Saccharibacteria bacterium]